MCVDKVPGCHQTQKLLWAEESTPFQVKQQKQNPFLWAEALGAAHWSAGFSLGRLEPDSPLLGL